MWRFRLLPWEYAVRNLFRRPVRSALTLSALTLVIFLVFVVVGFIRGLELSLAVSGDPQVVLVHSLGAAENVEISSIAAGKYGEVEAGLKAIFQRPGPGNTRVIYASPEVYLGTQVKTEGEEQLTLGLIRGVTPTALLVRRKVQILDGRWPGPGEVLVGRLAAAKLGRDAGVLAVGRSLTMEGQPWRISGHFAALGSGLESELWCPLDDLQHALKRKDLDLSIVALTMAPGTSFGDVQEFFMERLNDLELQATPETAYYQALHKHYAPVRALAWLVVVLVAGAGIFAGLNTMYGAVVGRVRELATLQTLGFSRRAIALSLIQEGALLAAAGAVLAAAFALLVVNGTAVRFTMGAFTLRVDSVALLIGCGTGLLLGVVGAIPPAVRALRLVVADGLKAV